MVNRKNGFFIVGIALALSACSPNRVATTDLSSANTASDVSRSSCSVSQEADGARINCTDGTTAFVPNGTNGSSCSIEDLGKKSLLQCADGTFSLIEDGQDATSTEYSITKIIDPCGPESAYDEVLLQFSNGDILAHYSDAKNEHFSLLHSGNYITTDGTKCEFKVSDTKEISW